MNQLPDYRTFNFLSILSPGDYQEKRRLRSLLLLLSQQQSKEGSDTMLLIQNLTDK